MAEAMSSISKTLAILLLWPGLSLAAPPELEFAKGVVAFSRGDLEEAEKRFMAVLQQAPDHPQATYYLGQAALGQKKFDSAVGLFRQAARLQPSNRAIRLDLALALVRLDCFEEAEAELEAVSDALADRASFQYYLGFCRYRLGRYRRALVPLRRARDLDQGFGAAAGYYLGLAHFKLGEQEEASRQFGLVASGEAGERMAAFARQNLALLAEERQDVGEQARRWGAFASTGGGYDSNVTLNPSDASGMDAATAFISAGGFYSPFLSKQDEVRVAANLYRSFYTREDISGFNLTDLSATARWRHLFAAGHRLELAYLLDLDMLDGGGEAGQILDMDDFGMYMEAHGAFLQFRVYEGRSTETSLAYHFQASFFQGRLQERDSLGHELSVRQEVLLLQNRLRLAALVGAVCDQAEEDWWNLLGPFAGLEVRYRAAEWLTVWGRGAFHYRDHFDSEGYLGWGGGRKRTDRLWTAACGVNFRIHAHLALGVSYQYMNNDSLDLFTYDRHMFTLAVFTHL
jgi:tetratricopeptide (TPR) repeat protein